MPPQDTCVPSSLTLRCPAGSVIVVTSAEYGVAQVDGSCSYTPGDCIADAMSIVVCVSDSVTCSIYATKKKLPECNDQFGSYVHIEYDCVPMSMNDPAQEYNVCQQNSTDITSDRGILKSPGYPSQFQLTPSECFRAIHVPDNKVVRLWLSDLYVSSAGINCPNDHVYVVDNVQTFRHCGLKRYAYPYLCSSTIIIQYKTTTQSSFYRGMRMYFEIVDRSPNDNCPTGSVTPVPATTPSTTTIETDVTTAIPIYVVLGIASPIRSFQICKGESHTLQCPTNYVVAVRTNIYGVTPTDQCEEHDASKHCVLATDPTFYCRQSCTYMYTGNRVIPSCSNKIAAYQYVEYQCIPLKTELVSPNTTCPADGSKVPIQIDRRGRFQSYRYGSFVMVKMNCTYRLKTKPGDIMHIYSLDVSLSDYSSDCTDNKLSFIEDGEIQGSDFCEERSFRLLYSTCSNEIDMRYIVTDDSMYFSDGAELYIESQARPSDWSCGKPLPTTPIPPTQPTIPIVTQTAVPLTNETSMFARDEIETDICFKGTSSYTCPLGYTFIMIDAFYGVKKQSSNKCGFVQGDCVHDALPSLTICRNDAAGCFMSYPTQRRLAQCSDNYADYLHITHQCVPSRPVGTPPPITVYDICDTNAPIANINGVVTSPNFPTYKQTNTECKRSLVGMTDRVLKIWINEMAVSSDGVRSLAEESDEPDLVIYKNYDTKNLNDFEKLNPSIRDVCIKDYLIINAPHVAYVYCGTRKFAMAPICAANIDIQYKTTSTANFLYKGFKLYFEWVPKPMDIICDNNPLPSTTTPIDEVIPFWAQNLQLSPILSAQICLGTAHTLRCPRGSDYVLSIISSSYGVTGTGLCEIPASNHCHQEASLGLTCTHSCFIEYIIPRPLTQCNAQNADYISIDYECIPTRLPNSENPIDICASTTTDTIAMNSGIMISPQYPILGAARTCSKKIETLPNKLWMVFIVDLFLEGGSTIADTCDAASLNIYDGNDRIIRCGLQQPELVLVSCSNIVEFKFVSTHQALGYRGFKIFFQTIDVPSNWACKPSGFTTPAITTTTTRPPTTSGALPPSFQIVAYGGTTNNTRQYCKFPFTYQGNSQATCLRTDPPSSPSGQTLREPWCSLTSNFDTDHQWGYCELGVTDSTFYDICRSQSQSLRCPPGYVIDIITADYAAKPDGNIGSGSCMYDKNDCFQSDTLTVQTTCAGKPSCTVYHFIRTLTACQSRSAAYLHVHYECIPSDIPEITTYDICNNNTLPQGDTRRGFIVSPNFPNTQANLDCTFNLHTLKPHQDIHVYIVDMDLTPIPLLGQSCTKDRLIIDADNNIMEMCGRSYTNFLINTCHASVSFQLIRASDAKGRGVKFYFEFRERPPTEVCPVLYTTTLRPSTAPTPPRPTTEPTRPVEFPHPPPRDIKTLCYPDLSSLFGTNNFQCPADYIIVIQRAFYGKGTRCTYTPGDCTTEADIVYRTCSGKQACSVSFINTVPIPECNNAIASYLFVEYQCLPTPTIVASSTDLCTAQIDIIAGPSGMLKSPSYPTYAQSQCANVTLNSSDSNMVMYMYLLDLNIDPIDPTTGRCTKDYLSLSYQCNNLLYNMELCGTRPTELLFSTCSPTDKIFASYNLVSQDFQSQRGFALLYHLVPQSAIPTLPSPPTPTTQMITTTTLIPGPGPLSTPNQVATTCVAKSLTIRCEQPQYGLVIHKVELAAGTPGTCTYSSQDCFEDRTNSYTLCGGLATCSMYAPTGPMRSCNNSQSTYLYAEYQCIPTRPKLNLDVCASANTQQKVDGGAIISSINYTSASQQCVIQLQSNTLLGSQHRKGFRVYILSLNLPMQSTLREQGAQCSENGPHIELNDYHGTSTRLCGNGHTRYLFETCAETIDIRYNNVQMNTGTTRYKGFQLYFESILNDKCPTFPPIPATTPTPTPPLAITNGIACGLTGGRERADFSCTADHGLVFLQSYQFITKQPDRCDVSEHTCYYPSEQPASQCSGQQACSYIHVMPSMPTQTVCANRPGDSVEFYYQCLPMRPSSSYHTYTLCQDQQTSQPMGFIQTASYPNTYANGVQHCSLRIPLPNDGRTYSVYLYVLDLSLRDYSVIDLTTSDKCFDSIKYTDGGQTYELCGRIDQPAFIYHSNEKALNLTLNISTAAQESVWNDWQGARLFYIIGNQALPRPPTSITTTSAGPEITTSTRDPTITDPTPDKKPSHGGTIAGVIIGVLAVIAAVIGFLYYRRRIAARGNGPTVSYDANQVTMDNPLTTTTKSKQITSIPPKSFGPSTITSPFYQKPAATEKGENDDAADA